MRNSHKLLAVISLLGVLFVGSGRLSAQTRSCTGTVTDAQGEPVIGASVLIKNAPVSTGTVTDPDGNFVQPNAKIGDVLVISSIGFETVEVAWNGQPVSVSLRDDMNLLNEVVVTGYGGTQRRTKVTNSIAKVQEDVLNKGTYSNVGSALSGAVSGLRVTSGSGRPGASPTITLRGGTDWNGTGTPLVVIDGQLRDGLNDINPEDIESMEVLKDAGATAIYGARASNGVLLITTKTGRTGNMQVNLKARYGYNYLNNGYKFLGAEDYITYLRKAYADPLQDIIWKSRNQKATLTAGQPFGTGNALGAGMRWNLMNYSDEYADLLNKGWKKMEDPVNPGKYLLYKETNPADYNINNPAVTQDYNVNFSGGNDRGHYFASLGHNYQQGMPINTYYKRYSFTFNGDYMVTNWLKSISKFSYNRANWDGLPATQTSESNYFGRIMSTPPTVRMVDEDGNPCLGPSAGDGNQSYQNDKFYRDYQSDKFTMIQGFEAKILPNLIFKANGQWYISEEFDETFNKDYETQINTFDRTRTSQAGFFRDFVQTYNATLNFNETFADVHNVDLLVGGEYYNYYTRGFSAKGQGAPTDDFIDLGLTVTDAGKRTIDSWHERRSIVSAFGRFNYDYMEKYLFSATFRYDGYSSLLDNRWGFFPGVSAGWVFSKEDFMDSTRDWLSFGKIRASYGQNGNATGIGSYDLQGSYGTTKYDGSVGFLIGSLPNPSLRWERTNTVEGGIDLGFFQNRLNVNLTGYNRITSDKYADFTLPPTTGFSSIKNNNGVFRNRGLELEVNAKLLRTRDITWNFAANITYNKNKVITLPDNDLENNRQGGVEVYVPGSYDPATGKSKTMYVGGYQEGQEPGMMVGYVFKGLYQSDDEVPYDYLDANGNPSGKAIISYAKFKTMSQSDQENKYIPLRAGDVIWEDINGDGIIDVRDQKVIGNTIPHWFGGFNTQFSWKGLSFYARFDYALGFWNYDRSTPWFNGCGQGTYNATTEVLRSWSEDNKSGVWPRYVFFDYGVANNYFRPSTLFACRGDYLAVRELQLSYALPKVWVEKLNMRRIEFSVTGQNLGYLTAYPGNTPEQYAGTSFASGDGYGLPRTILFGIDVTF